MARAERRKNVVLLEHSDGLLFGAIRCAAAAATSEQRVAQAARAATPYRINDHRRLLHATSMCPAGVALFGSFPPTVLKLPLLHVAEETQGQRSEGDADKQSGPEK